MNTHKHFIKTTAIILALLAAAAASPKAVAQALTMDGNSGIFFQPWAYVVPSSHNKLNNPTLAYHAVTAGPVAGDYFNVSLEEGFGGWLEFGYTRDNHTDGGNPTYSPLFNEAGMNIFNAKAKVVPEGFHQLKWVPAVSVGGVLRTNDPFVSQAAAKTNATNGDLYGVATKLVIVDKKLPLLLSGGARGTNAEVYGYGGNATNWQARAFGALAIPIPYKHVVFAPTVEIDQEPHHLKYVAYANLPTTEVYAVRLSDAVQQKWAVDIGTGHVASSVYPGIGLKVNNALAVAFDYRF